MAKIETIKSELAKMYSIWGHMVNSTSEVLAVRNQQYAKALADVPDDLLIAAVDQLINESEFFPSVAAIRKCAFGLQRHAEGGDIDPTEAFGVIMQMASARGRDATEEERRRYLADRLPGRVVDITMATIKALGWQAICNEDLSRVDTLRAQWRGCFNAIQKRSDDLTAMSPTVRAFIAELAQKFTIDSARLQSPKRDDFEGDDETF